MPTFGFSDVPQYIKLTYDPVTGLLSFAGAKNNLYILRKGEFIQLKGDRKPIDLYEINADNGFTNHEIKLDPGDTVYMFTDGYPDQFGGDRNKKLMSKTLLQKIADFAHLEMEEQKMHFYTLLMNGVEKMSRLMMCVWLG